MARKEIERYRLEQETDTFDWNSIEQELDSGIIRPRFNLVEEDAAFDRAIYRYVLAAQIDKGEAPVSLHDLTFKTMDEYLNRRRCPKCAEPNSTSSFQHSEPCEKCGTRLEPILLQM